MRYLLALLVTPLLYSFQSFALDEVVLPLKGMPPHLELHKLVQVDQFRIGSLLADPLFRTGETSQLNPLLAKTVEWSNNGNTLRIELKAATFTDGSKINAASVIESILRCMSAKKKDVTSSFAHILGYQAFQSGETKKPIGIKALGVNTIEFRLSKPSPLLIDNLSLAACSIVKSRSGSADLLKNAHGSGPYILVSKSDTELLLKKRDTYYSTNSGPAQIRFKKTQFWGNYKKLKDTMSLIVTESDPGDTPEFNRLRYSRLGAWQLSFNNAKPPFNNINLRKAVSYAIDYQMLSKDMGWSPERMQAGIIPFAMRGFRKRDISQRQEAKANKILRSLGYSKSKPFKLSILISHRKDSEKEAKLWPRLFHGTPIRATVQLISQEELMERRKEGSFQILKHGKAPGSIDPYILLASYLSSSRYNTPRAKTECDETILKATSTLDREKRYQVYVEADLCLMSHHIIVPLASLNPGFALIRKPWKHRRKNQYLLYPFFANEWIRTK